MGEEERDLKFKSPISIKSWEADMTGPRQVADFLPCTASRALRTQQKVPQTEVRHARMHACMHTCMSTHYSIRCLVRAPLLFFGFFFCIPVAEFFLFGQLLT